MTQPWWDIPGAQALVEGGAPVLFPGTGKTLLQALQTRIPGFVPEWRDLSEEDAGLALVRLFGLQLEPILARGGRLPEKALIEFLSTAGISLNAPRSARAMIQFTPRSSNTDPVDVPVGFRLLSARTDGEKGDVNWETEAALAIANAALAEIHAFDGETALAVKPGEVFKAFGDRPKLNAALYLGFEVEGTAGNNLSIGVEPRVENAPAPVAQGGPPPAGVARPVLRWEALSERGFARTDVPRDSSALLTRTGIVTLALPRQWIPGRPAILGEGADLCWLRLRLASGTFTDPPSIAGLYPHAVMANAHETHRDEFPVPENDGANKIIHVSQKPVLPGSVLLDVDEGAVSSDLFAINVDSPSSTESGSFRRWREVESLAGERPDARVFVLDAATGTLRFGDNREGMTPPPGIRNIAVRSYKTTSGAAGNVAKGEISRMPNPTPGIETVTNPLSASGGAAVELLDDAITRGPAQIKARGRAVTRADVALLASEADGADIVRAYTLSGVDPALPGAVLPGTIGVFVIARRQPDEPDDTPPVASSETLRAVARYLADTVGPVGARVSVGNPRYHDVRIEAAITIASGRDAGAAASAVTATLNRWLNPQLSGTGVGDWQIGAKLRHADLTHLVLNADEGIVSVPFLALSIDGISHPACSDVALSRFGLPWPGRHRLLVEIEEAGR